MLCAMSELPRGIRVAGRAIGEGHPCYVIAEAGSNHDGDLAVALALIDAAAEARCDAVKFQVFRPEELVARVVPHAPCLDGVVRPGQTLFELFGELAIDRAWLPTLAARARERRIHFLATPFDLAAVDELVAPSVDMPAIKTASAELGHLPLLAHAARTGRPLLVSTGMSTLAEVERALEAIAAAGAPPVALFHCTVLYPAPPGTVNLRAIDTLRAAFGVPVGLSDHTLGTWAPVAAVARGANLIEKHFTLSRARSGPDHPFAIEPHELAGMVEAIRATEAALGDGRKVRQPDEEPIYAIARRNLVAARDLRAGEALAAPDLLIVRSTLGIPPFERERVIGRLLTRDVAAGTPLQWSDFAPR
jgi:N,N'-diacetyllegionaminate synthase